MNNVPNFTERDIDNLVRSFGKPGPEHVRTQVMTKVAQMDRELTKVPLQIEPRKQQKKRGGRQRD